MSGIRAVYAQQEWDDITFDKAKNPKESLVGIGHTTPIETHKSWIFVHMLWTVPPEPCFHCV
jgi:hypothetical protein